MNKSKPIISVIIPTHNRSESLIRTLDALCRQTYPLEKMEVLIVADGCTDNTTESLSKYRAPFEFNVIEQSQQGLAAARNRGATKANGEILLFLDDDIIPNQNLIETHIKSHIQNLGDVMIGYYPMTLTNFEDYYKFGVWAAWEYFFYPLRHPSHRYNYRDLLFGNSSIKKDLFEKAGGFDTEFRSYGREDWEFGVRLIKLGARFHFTAEAIGYHHPTVNLRRGLDHKRSEGRADAKIGKLHPELRSVLPFSSVFSSGFSLSSIIRSIAAKWSFSLHALSELLVIVLHILERFKRHVQWSRLWEAISDYWYFRGVGDEIGAGESLSEYLNQSQNMVDNDDSVIEIDLFVGIEKAEQLLNKERPSGLKVYYGEQFLGFIPVRPGAEKLRGKHLRKLLSTELAIPLLKALAIHGVIAKSAKNNYLAFTSDKEIDQWIDTLQGQRTLLDRYGGNLKQWQWMSDIARTYWLQQGGIRNLELARDWLDKERYASIKLACERERLIIENQKTIYDLEEEILSFKGNT